MVLIAGFSASAGLKGQDDEAFVVNQDDSARICSIFEAAALNAAAVRQGDFLVRRRETFDTVNRFDGMNTNGIVRFGESWQRVVFDLDSKQYCVLTVKVVTETNLANLGTAAGAEKKMISRSGKALDRDGQLITRLFPGETKNKKLIAVSDNALLGEQAVGFPDYRSFGLFVGGKPGSFLTMTRKSNLLKTGSMFFESTDVGNDSVSIVFHQEMNSGQLAVDEYTVDTVNFVPLALYSYHQNLVPGDRKVFAGKQTFQWGESNGIQLPLSGHADIPHMEYVNGEQQGAHCYTDIDFHWFSVNEIVDKKWFDGSQFADFEAFKKLLDPESCGALNLSKLKR